MTVNKSVEDALRHALDGRWRSVREDARRQLADPDFIPNPTATLAEAREHTLGLMRRLVDTGLPAAGFTEAHGGTGNVGQALTGFEMLAAVNLSLMVKAGVQWGLFGGAVENLGTEAHHREYLPRVIDGTLLGCFAMTETGHGSNVDALETTATYDSATDEFIVDSPVPSARKDYIGGAAEHARIAAVFAALIVDGENHGVHCLLVPIRDENGADLPGITTSDCGPKGGLPGVDNGRIVFNQVRVPRANLLNRYGDVDHGGHYTSPIKDRNKRFFTMLGALIRGRISVAGSAGAASRFALTIATEYALARRQFDAPGGGDTELRIMDYRTHQRRLLPLIAKSYALMFAQGELVEDLHALQSDPPDETINSREIESRAAGLKAVTTWHATHAINEARESCGGAGYLAENRITTLRADIDVFTTFEGDNHVLIQLVAKELISAYAEEVRGLDARGWVRFVANAARDAVADKTLLRPFIQTLLDSSDEDVANSDLSKRGNQIRLFLAREEHLLRTAAARLRRAAEPDVDAFEVFNNAQDHIVKLGVAHIDRLVLEAFAAGIERIEDPEAAKIASTVCDLYAYSTIESDLAWYLMHHYVSTDRAKMIRRGLNELCTTLRPYAAELVGAFGFGDDLHVAMLRSPGVDLPEAANS